MHFKFRDRSTVSFESSSGDTSLSRDIVVDFQHDVSKDLRFPGGNNGIFEYSIWSILWEEAIITSGSSCFPQFGPLAQLEVGVVGRARSGDSGRTVLVSPVVILEALAVEIGSRPTDPGSPGPHFSYLLFLAQVNHHVSHILVGSSVDHKLSSSWVGGCESLFVVLVFTGLNAILRLFHVVSTRTPPGELFVESGHHHTIMQNVCSADFIGNLLAIIIIGPTSPCTFFWFDFGDLSLEGGDEGGLGGVFSLQSSQLTLQSSHFCLQSGYFPI